MAHDHNGRVGPPRCEECNAPLNSDDRRSASLFARSLCLDCHIEIYPFARMKKKKRHPSRGLRFDPPLQSVFGIAISGPEAESLVRP
jgi:hypothetical protein